MREQEKGVDANYVASTPFKAANLTEA